MASSSHRRSQQAVQLVECERAARALECQKFEDKIAMLKFALKDQLEVSQEAAVAIKQIKVELQTSRDESRKWQDKLRASRFLSHSQTGPSRPLGQMSIGQDDVTV